MTELEQLRREVNELRERLAKLEDRKQRLEPLDSETLLKEMDALKKAWADKQPPWPLHPPRLLEPVIVPLRRELGEPHWPPGTIIC